MSNRTYRPKAPIIGADGNIFNLIGIANISMREAGIEPTVITNMNNRVYQSKSYDEALAIIYEHVEPVSQYDLEDIGFNEQHMDF